MRFLDNFGVVPVIMPVNLATAANVGDWISLKEAQTITFLFLAAIGAAGEDPVITLRQAQNVAGLNAKDLVAVSRVLTKQGADLAVVGAWTKVTQAAAATYTDAVSGEAAKLWAIEVDATDLDVNGGFDCITLNIADPGATAQLGCVLAILSGQRYGAGRSAIVD